MKHHTEHNSGDGTEISAPQWMLGRCERWLESQSRPGILLIGLILLIVIGALHYAVGPQISASLFYLLPVLLVARFAGARSGMMASLAASGFWLLADLRVAPEEVNSITIYWNATMRLGVFLVAVWLVSAMRSLNAQLEHRVQDRTAALEDEVRGRRELEKKILEISDREQARIGQDLHDGLCQHLVSTAFSANLLHEQLAAQARPESNAAREIGNLLDESITQARRLAQGLYPVRVESEGLATSLQGLSSHTSSRFNLSCAVSCSGDVSGLDGATAIHLYRIAQEAITNAAKHARARKILVGLLAEGQEVRLTVEDDGEGIQTRPRNPEGMGIHIMEYRARMIHGTLEIGHGSAGGTLVICRIERQALHNCNP